MISILITSFKDNLFIYYIIKMVVLFNKFPYLPGCLYAVMDDLISLIIVDRDSSRITEIAHIIGNLTEIEAKLFKANYEKALKSIPESKRRESGEYFREIMRRVVSPSKKPENNGVTHCSTNLNSPEKQASSNTRWSISREERRKILELMERGREEQKQRKKKNWCRLGLIDEFE